MLDKLGKLRALALLSFMIILTACGYDQSAEIDVEIDKDMVEAEALANQYLQRTNAREGAPLSLTNLKLKDGKLQFSTNTDSVRGYEDIAEESVTAELTPGEYNFWHAGGGVDDLDEIEFDESSMLKLVDAPEEAHADKMWVIMIPEDYQVMNEEDGDFLKYDIAYRIKGGDGTLIRLDPKVKINPPMDE